MDKVMTYVIGGIIGLLILFSLTPSVLDQYNEIDFADAPGGVEAAVGAVLTVFFVLVLWKLYKNS